MDLIKKYQQQTLSGLEALELLRQLRGTSTKSLPDTADPKVKLAFGRGHRIVGPSATAAELLAAPTVLDPDVVYIRVDVARREQPALVCAKGEADCFSLCWNDVIGGNKVHREGTRLYALEREVSVLEFLEREGCDPVVVYRKRQEPIIEYELVPLEKPEPEKKAEPIPEPESIPAPAIDYEFLGQVERDFDVDYTGVTEPLDVPKTLQSPEEPKLDPQSTSPQLVKRPVGRPKAKVQLTEAERKAAYRLKLKSDEARRQERIESSASQGEADDSESVSVLDSYRPIAKDRGGKTSGVPKNLLVKRVLEQDERCIYCDRRFGSMVLINGEIKLLKAQPDHFQPVADRRNDNPSNIYAADQICNERIKGSRKFATLEEARTVIQAAWAERGWTDTPLLMPFQPTTDPMIYGCPN